MDAGASPTDQRAVIEAHLRRLDAPALAAFVEDLWAARGFDTDRDGTVVWTSWDGQTRYLSVGGQQPVPGGDAADLVVDTSGGSIREGTTVVDASELTEQLRYAVERPVARQLCERHLGAGPESLSAPTGMSLRRLVRRFPLAVGAVTVVAVLVAVALATGASGVVPAVTGDATTPTAGEQTGTPGGLPAGPSDTAESLAGQPLPPGVTAEGLSDVDALAAAHDEAIDGRSYSLWTDVDGAVLRDGAIVRARRDIDATVEGERYRVDTDQVVAGDRTTVRVRYHDGQRSYVARSDRASAQPRRLEQPEERGTFPPTPVGLTDALVRTRLSTPNTALTGTVERDGRTLYRLAGSGQPEWPAVGGVDEYEVTALVTLDGVVREVDIRYTVRSGTRRVEVRRQTRYGDIGETTVTPPAWYRTAGNRTGVGR